MKKSLALLLFVFSIFTLSGCHNEGGKDFDTPAFKIVGIYSGIGGTQKGDKFQSTFGYTILVESTYKARDIRAIKAALGDKIRGRTVSQTPPEIKSDTDIIEIQGSVTFDTTDMTKEQIESLGPYIKSITIELTNGDTYTLPFSIPNNSR